MKKAFKDFLNHVNSGNPISKFCREITPIKSLLDIQNKDNLLYIPKRNFQIGYENIVIKVPPTDEAIIMTFTFQKFYELNYNIDKGLFLFKKQKGNQTMAKGIYSDNVSSFYKLK